MTPAPPETFRWKPNLALILAYATGVTALVGIVSWRLIFVHHIFLGNLGILVGLALGAFFNSLFRYRLESGADVLVFFRGNRERWRIPWPDLLEVTHDEGTRLTEWNRLVLRTPTGERTIKLDDTLAGRWEHPDRLLNLLRSRTPHA